MSDPHADVVQDDDDPTAATTIVVGAVSVILLVVIVIALEALYLRTTESEQSRKAIADSGAQLRRVRVEQLEQLSTFRLIDAEQGTVAIPIERAMELLVQEAARP